VFSGIAWPNMNGRGHYKLVLSMKECSGVAWPGLLKVGNVTKTVLKLSKASEEWHVPQW
jgi:hypothetical protein